MICQQDGIDHWTNGYATYDTEIDLPDKIKGRQLSDWNFVGIEFDPKRGDE